MRLIHYNAHLRYVVQYVLPVNNPEKNVLVTFRKGVYIFEIPLNHPFAHTIGLRDLIDATNAAQLSTLSTGLNNSVQSSNPRIYYAKKAPEEVRKVVGHNSAPQSYRLESGSSAEKSGPPRNGIFG